MGDQLLTMEEDWYHIGEVWDLWVSGKLQEVEVLHIKVEEKETGGYNVDHYGRLGEFITSVTLNGEEIREVVDESDLTEKPSYV